MKRCKEMKISLHKVYTFYIYRICYTRLNHGGKGSTNYESYQIFKEENAKLFAFIERKCGIRDKD